MQKNFAEAIINLSASLRPANNNDIREQMIALVNTLINKDFHSLIQLLYQIDVSEIKIRSCLQNNTDKLSADIIADLIIERQLQKIKSRKAFSKNDTFSDEEKW